MSKRALVRLVPLLIAATMAHLPSPVVAQTPTRQSSPSPAAQTDLTKPAFDTVTPLYNVTHLTEKASQTIVAEVDGRPITLGEVGDIITQMPTPAKQQPFETLFAVATEQLIRRHALIAKAQRTGVDALYTVRRRAKSATEQAIAAAMLEQDLKAAITEPMLLEKYNSIFEGKPGPTEVHVWLILTTTEEAAAKAIKDIKNGSDFAVVARDVSQDTSAPRGGDLGFVRREALMAELGAVAFALPPDQISSYPVRAPGGWFVVRAQERRVGTAPNFFEVREAIRQIVEVERVTPIVKEAIETVTVRRYPISGREEEAAQ